jgi:hypothetical protein
MPGGCGRAEALRDDRLVTEARDHDVELPATRRRTVRP